MTERIESPTWSIHGVFDPDSGRGTVFHTHGMDKYTGGPELELNLPLGEQGGHFINIVGLAIANGEIPAEPGRDTTLFSVPMLLVFRDRGIDLEDEVLRIVFPDPAGRFPGDPGCEAMYENQASDEGWLLPKEGD